LEDCGQTGQAVTQWLALVNHLSAVNGDALVNKLTALQQIGRVLEAALSDSAAEDALKQSLDLNPHQPEVTQHWISLRQRQVKWPVMNEWDRVSRSALQGGISSLSLACYADDPMFQLAKAYHYAFRSTGMPKPVARAVNYEPGRGEQAAHRLHLIRLARSRGWLRNDRCDGVP